jgi:hypothetical protein
MEVFINIATSRLVMSHSYQNKDRVEWMLVYVQVNHPTNSHGRVYSPG